jgi:hypothetical protein
MKLALDEAAQKLNRPCAAVNFHELIGLAKFCNACRQIRGRVVRPADRQGRFFLRILFFRHGFRFLLAEEAHELLEFKLIVAKG